MRSLACLLLASALLAGCSDAPTPSAGNPPAEPVPEGIASGPVADLPVPPAGDGRTLKVVQVEEDGVLPPAAGKPNGGMVGAYQFNGPFEWRFRHDAPGTVVSADLVLTWTPAAGASPTLRLIFSQLDEHDGIERMADERREADGESPLRLQLDGLDWDHGTYAVAAWWGGDVAHTPTGQEFHIEGTITYLD